MVKTEQQPPSNRAWRRRMLRGVAREPIAKAESEHQQIDRALGDSNQISEAIKKDYNDHFTSIVYTAPPFIFRWMTVRKDHGRITQQILRLNMKADAQGDADRVYTNAENDLFTKNIREVSLADIDAMHLPLKQEDRQRIYSLFNVWKLRRPKQNQLEVVNSLAYLASVPLAQGIHSNQIPESIRHLEEVAQDFFDYYVQFLRDGSPSINHTLRTSFALGKIPLLMSIAAYMPARLDKSCLNKKNISRTRYNNSFGQD